MAVIYHDWRVAALHHLSLIPFGDTIPLGLLFSICPDREELSCAKVRCIILFLILFLSLRIHYSVHSGFVKGDLAPIFFLRQKYVKNQCKIQNAKILISTASAQSLRFLASNAAAKVHTAFELRKDTSFEPLLNVVKDCLSSCRNPPPTYRMNYAYGFTLGIFIPKIV